MVLSNLLNLGTYTSLLYNILLALIIPNVLNVIIFSKTDEFQNLIKRIKF